MKMVVLVMTLVAVAGSAPAGRAGARQTSAPATQTCTLTITGMTCAGCEAAVRIAARSVEGVTAVTVSYATGKAEITYDPAKTTPAAVAAVITRKSGFKAEPTGKKP